MKAANPQELDIAQRQTEHYVAGLDIGRRAVRSLNGVDLSEIANIRSIDDFPPELKDTMPFKQGLRLHAQSNTWGPMSAILNGWETGVRYELEKGTEA